MSKGIYNCNIEINHPSGIEGFEIPVSIHYICHPAHKGATDGRYGPKLEPDEPAYIEIDWIEGPDGRPIDLTTKEEYNLLEYINRFESEKYE